MLRLIASGLVAAGVVVAGVPAGAAPSEGAPPIVDTADRHGDVKVHGSADGLDPAIVSSVDLRHVTVTRQGHGARVVVRLKEVLAPRGRYIQLVSVALTTAGQSGWLGSVPGSISITSATPQHVGGALAFYVDDLLAEGPDGPDGPDGEEEDGGEDTLICHVAAAKGANVLSLVVPDRCLPPGPAQLVVNSVLIDKRSLQEEDPSFIEDILKVRGPVDLRP